MQRRRLTIAVLGGKAKRVPPPSTERHPLLLGCASATGPRPLPMLGQGKPYRHKAAQKLDIPEKAQAPFAALPAGYSSFFASPETTATRTRLATQPNSVSNQTAICASHPPHDAVSGRHAASCPRLPIGSSTFSE